MTRVLSEEVPIEDHGLIGNMRSAALVSLEGDVDFFCYPEFDSPTIFASLLDHEKGGVFSLAPVHEGWAVEQLYVPDTNVLQTRFLFDDATAEVTDFLPIRSPGVGHCLVRRVTALAGRLPLRMICQPRFDYARATHRVERRPGGAAFLPTPAAGGSAALAPLELRASVPLEVEGDAAVAVFHLGPGESAWFAFGSPDELPSVGDALSAKLDEACDCAADYWRAWVRKSTYRGRWRELVTRSSLVLKLLTSEKYGSLIAAPTFGLPERIGGPRNWDYRYTWLRDASFSLYALSRLGYDEESRHFNHWIKDRIVLDAKHEPLQTMYRTNGGTELDEIELAHLRGYRGSKPVRIGNAAHTQLQLDIFGELFDAAYLSSKYGDAIPHDGWVRMKRVLAWLAQHWSDPDDGIWEVRGGRREFLHSRLMCWVAFDRAIRLANKRSLAGPIDWIEKARDAVTEDIYANFWNEERQAFVQSKGSDALDASALLMPLMRFIGPADPRWISTLAAIDRELTQDVLVMRYRTETGVDGLPEGEGSFTACGFWFIEALARSGQVARAHALFEKLVSFANHVGLYSEELGRKGEHLGNFPQGLTHLALISAATYLDRRLANVHEPWS
jgi:GH15 family glucan-1,4-alpha-glucosidase